MNPLDEASLVAPGGLLPEVLHAARAQAQASRRRMVHVLDERLGLAPAEFVALLGNALRYPTLDINAMYDLSPAFDLLSYAESLQHECVLFRDPEGRLILVFGDPFSNALHAWAEERIRPPFAWRLAHHADVVAFLARYEESLRALDNVLLGGEHQDDTIDDSDELSLRKISEDASPVVRLVHSTLYDALKINASDIHIETVANGLLIKYRIDGVLTTVGTPHGQELAEQVISRIKVVSDLDISERRIPQDGRFKISIKGRQVDFRVSIMPSICGEDAVLRILDKQTLADEVHGLRLESLGFDEASLTALRRLSHEPYGMVLVTGPTGSGKTTTLYAAISEINDGHDKIITIEDPVEY
ncbi:MAG: GspE/PulE family protein, partial [Burkholderiales bacterium]